MRPIGGIIETPSLRPDGSLLNQPGYDEGTGYLYEPSRVYPTIADHPTVDDARAALRILEEPWVDFPFATVEARYVPIAAFLSLVARPAIVGACPAVVIDASTRGSGKTLIARAITTLAHGREAAPMTWPTGHSGDAETEKILASYALRGASVIVWDNVTGKFGGPALDKCLTATRQVDLRVLGLNEVRTLAWRAVMLVTGNNIELGGDTTRRVLISRLEPTIERPEERTAYAIANLHMWCRRHHPRLVAAALTLLRAFIVAGRPSQGLAGWGSFEEYRDLITAALVWAGAPDVMATRPTLAGDDDVELGALRTLVAKLPRLAPHGMTAKMMIDVLYPPQPVRGVVPLDGYDALREALEVIAPPRVGRPPEALRLGQALSRLRGRRVGAHFLERTKNRDGVAVWSVREQV